MTLVLEIEHLLGVAFAAPGQASELPDWPPQPDRIFSALVAAWGVRGECDGGRRVLEWLEALPAPDIVASDGFARTAPIVFVPPNDAEGGRVGNAAVFPPLRRRQARRFPAYRPDDPVVSLIWRDVDPDPDTLAALNALAADTAYVGHSASLTRCYFRGGELTGAGASARRRVYSGRLAELERGFHAKPPQRPSPGVPVRAAQIATQQTRNGVFSDRWLVLEHIDGTMPDIRATAPVAKGIRNAIMAGYREIGLEKEIPSEVSGHSADGKPSSEPHLAIAPLAFLGWPHASGAVLGFALVTPRGGNLLADPDFQRAMRAIMQRDADGSRRLMRLDSAGLRLAFAIGSPGDRRSLDPMRYLGAARVWASCTPIVLDRHLKSASNEAREQEIRTVIGQACANFGLPEPRRIADGKHSAVEGSPSAYPSGRAPRWLRWRLPESLASRQLTHAVLEFAEPIHGPVILGAGRFVGLGLCLPLDGESHQ
jgi:CRISPR-associated protein Csb2